MPSRRFSSHCRSFCQFLTPVPYGALAGFGSPRPGDRTSSSTVDRSGDGSNTLTGEMSPELERLIQLQHLESTIADARARIAAHPQRLAEAEARLAEADRVVEGAAERLKYSMEARRTVEKDAAVYQGRLTKFKDQLSAVKTNREYTAMQHEIETAQKDPGAAEEKVLERMIEIPAHRRGEAGRDRAGGAEEGGRRRKGGARHRAGRSRKDARRNLCRPRRRGCLGPAAADCRSSSRSPKCGRAWRCRWPPGTACARFLTCGCGRRRSSRCGPTTASCSATAASAFFTGCRRPLRDHRPSRSGRDPKTRGLVEAVPWGGLKNRGQVPHQNGCHPIRGETGRRSLAHNRATPGGGMHRRSSPPFSRPLG